MLTSVDGQIKFKAMLRHPVYGPRLVYFDSSPCKTLTCAIPTLTRWGTLSLSLPLSAPLSLLACTLYEFWSVLFQFLNGLSFRFGLPVRVSRSLQSLVEAATLTLSLSCSLARWHTISLALAPAHR